MSEFELTIDGKKVAARKGQSILDVALACGIEVPRLCHHEGLSDVGACRLCIVEVEGQRRPVPSCSTPAQPGMVVVTDNEALWNLRRQTVELLFSERNHICPFCTRSGHCELQDAGYGMGMTHVRFDYLHPALPADQSHRHIALDHNRCILCGRCVRACDERAGVRTLGIMGRGRESMVVADDGLPLGESTCVSCGQCVEACPTGALFEKRTSHWKYDRENPVVRTVCPSCGVGCAADVSLCNEAILEVRGAPEAPNRGLLCRRGKFGLTETRPNRIAQPLVREAGELKPATYEAAFERIAKRLAAGRLAKDRTLAAGFVSARLPMEAMEAFARFMRQAVGTERLGVLGPETVAAFMGAIGCESRKDLAHIEDIESADLILSLGADPDGVQGVVGMAIRRRVRKGGATFVEVNPRATALSPLAEARLEVRYRSDAAFCDALLNSLATYRSVRERMGDAAADAEKVDAHAAAAQCGFPEAAIKRVAGLLVSAKRPLVMVGSGLARQGADTVAKALDVARALGADEATGRIGFLPLFRTANGAGACLLGLGALDPATFDPHSADILFAALGDDEEAADARLGEKIRKGGFSVVFASHASEATAFADVVFPAPVWSEREGTYINLEGRTSKAQPATPRPEGVLTEEEVLERLAEALGAGAAV